VFRHPLRSFRLVRNAADDAWIKLGDAVSVLLPGIRQEFIMLVERAGAWCGQDNLLDLTEFPGPEDERAFIAGRVFEWATPADAELSTRWWGRGEEGLRFPNVQPTGRSVCISIQHVTGKVRHMLIWEICLNIRRNSSWSMWFCSRLFGREKTARELFVKLQESRVSC